MLLTTDLSFSGDAGSDTFYVLSRADETVAFYHNATPATGQPVQVVRREAIGGVAVFGNGGDDTLTLDYAGIDAPLFPGGLLYDGGAADTPVGNRLVITNLPAGGDVGSFATPGGTAGQMNVDGPSFTDAVDYDGLTSVDPFAGTGGSNGLDVYAGTVTLADLPADGTGAVRVAAGATALFTGSATLASLTVDAGGTARVLADGTRLLDVAALSLTAPSAAAPGDGTPSAGGVLDLADNDLVVRGDPSLLPDVTALLAANHGYGVGWGGDPADPSVPTPPAIVCSAGVDLSASASTTISAGGSPAFEFATTLGVARVGDVDAPHAGLYDGRPVAAGDVLVRYTYAADRNLDGVVTPADTDPLVNGDLTGLSGWSNGDLDYSGTVDDDDVSIAENFESYPLLPAPVAEGDGSSYTLSFPSYLLTVPLGMTRIGWWSAQWGDGTTDVYPIPLGRQTPTTLSATHDYATADGTGPTDAISVAVGGYVDGDETTLVTYRAPHADLPMTPVPPTGLAATESAYGRVDLTWADASAVATAYRVTATPPAGNGPAVTVAVPAGVDGGSAAVAGLRPGVPYTFAVTALATLADGTTAASTPSPGLTAVAPAAALSATAPAAVAEGSPVTVTFHAATAAGSGSPVVAWHVDWGTYGRWYDGTGYAAGSTATSPPYAFPAGAASDVATVTATDAAGHTFTLPPVTVDVQPTAPTDVNVVSVTNTEICLNWTGTSSAATEYEIDRADAGVADYAFVADVSNAGPGSFSFTDTDVTASTQYQYAITALGEGPAESAAATSPVITTETGGLSLVAMPESGTLDGVVLTWTYHGHDDTGGYEIEQEDTALGENFHLVQTDPYAVPTSGTESTVVSGLRSGDVYTFRVRADLADGTATDWAVVALAPASLAAPTVSLGSDGSLVVDYPAGNAGSFEVQQRGGELPGPVWRFVDLNDYPRQFDALGPSGGIVAQGWRDGFGGVEFRVAADTAEGQSLWSVPVSVPLVTGTDFPAPVVVAQTVSDTEILFTVADGIGEPENYGLGNVLFLVDGTAGATGVVGVIPTVGSDGLCTAVYDATGLTPGTDYYAAAQTVAEPTDAPRLYSPLSQTTTGTTTGTTAPAAPSDLKATWYATGNTETEHKAHLLWHNNSPDETSFDVQRSTSSSFPADATLSDYYTQADRPNLDIPNQDYDHDYYYRVRAVKTVGGKNYDSAWSSTASLSVGPIVVGFYGADVAQIFGQNVGGGVNGYNGSTGYLDTNTMTWIKQPSLPGGNVEMNRVVDLLVDVGVQAKLFRAKDGLSSGQAWLLGNLDDGSHADGKYDPGNADPTLRDLSRPVDIVGHSWGGTTAIWLSEEMKLDSHFVGIAGKAVTNLITIDPVTFGLNLFRPSNLPNKVGTIGSTEVQDNVGWFHNWFQSRTTGNDTTHPIGAPWLVVYGTYITSHAQNTFEQDVFKNPWKFIIPSRVNHFNIIGGLEDDIFTLLIGRTLGRPLDFIDDDKAH